MKFTVIGHSCLRIETSGPTILVDPWLFGSCYWRSWWHYPTVAEPAPEVFEPDYVYLTHHHFDHFHFPSMREHRPERARARPGVRRADARRRGASASGSPRSWSCRTRRSCSSRPGCGWRRTSTGPTTRCSSWPTVTTSSSTSTTASSAVAPCERILDEFGRPTFVFKSYSFAQSYPILYTADDPADLELSPGTPTSTTGSGGRRARAALRRAVRQHGGVPPPRQPKGATSS